MRSAIDKNAREPGQEGGGSSIKDVLLKLGLDEYWERSEEGEGEATGNPSLAKRGTWAHVWFPPNLAQLALQISFVLSKYARSSPAPGPLT